MKTLLNALCFPPEVLDQHVGFLGKTGAGKSVAMRHCYEYLLGAKKRVCIIDPKGDHWGIKTAADGKSAGFNVIAFGDFKESTATDIPINAHFGKHVAELVATGNRPCVIGFRGWMTADMNRFWIDFGSTLFAKNLGELRLVIDEVQNFAPKGKIMDPDAGKCIHWTNRLMAEGRGYGIVCMVASQRPQKVHNDTLSACETLIAMRVVHSADRGAVKEWIDGAGDDSQGKAVLSSLAQMKRGEAYVWSPEVGFGPKMVKFPMPVTFDSFAPPQLQKRVSQEGWGSVDLTEVKERLANVIEEVKANDPALLKKEIATLKQQLAERPKVEQEVVKVPFLEKKDADLLNQVVAGVNYCEQRVADLLHQLVALNSGVEGIKKGCEQRFPVTTQPKRYTPASPVIDRVAKTTKLQAVKGNSEPQERLSDGPMAILNVIANYGSCGESTIAVQTGYKATSRYQYLKLLKREGLVVFDGGSYEVTDLARDKFGSQFNALPTGKALQEHWMQTLSGGELEIFKWICKVYPRDMGSEEIMDVTGLKSTSVYQYGKKLKARLIVQSTGAGFYKMADNLADH